MELLLFMNQFPKELKDIIFKFIPNKSLLCLNKSYYEYYHSILYSNLSKNRMESYVRFLIKKELYYRFQTVYHENIFVWKTKKSQYNNKKGNYLKHLNALCIQYKSQKCRKILNY